MLNGDIIQELVDFVYRVDLVYVCMLVALPEQQ